MGRNKEKRYVKDKRNWKVFMTQKIIFSFHPPEYDLIAYYKV